VVVAALGFRITLACFLDGPFVGLLGAICPDVSILATTPHRCNRLPNIIFLDLLLLLLVSRLKTSYWRLWAVPHVFFLWARDTDLNAPRSKGQLVQVAPQPPGGWALHALTLTHCEAGGATSGWWQLVGWFPPNLLAPNPVPVEPLPSFPIHWSVMDRVAATPVRSTLLQANSLPVTAVVRLPVELIGAGRGPLVGVVHQWGLFPASDLSASVLVVVVGSVLGLGVCRLSWLELALLWDVPILILDHLSEASDVDLLRGFCLLAPSKVLFASADSLLTTLFRGGSCFLAGGAVGPAPKLVGPAPKLDAALGLVVKDVGAVSEEQAHIQHTG
jgi:hypothetical protein